MLKREFKVEKQYLEDCCRNGVEVEPFVKTEGEINEAVLGLMKQIIYFKINILPADETTDMLKDLDTPNSPEKLLYDSAKKEIDELSEIVSKAINSRLDRSKLNSLHRSTIKTKSNKFLNEQCAEFITTKLTHIKTLIAQKQHERKEKTKMERDIGDKIKAIDKATANNNFLTMTLEMNPDPLYSADMVQQLIRLRLKDSTPIQNTYPPYQQQYPISIDQRIWLGLFELCDLVAEDLQVTRMQSRDTLKNALLAIINQSNGKEIYISVRAYSRNGSGHYFMLGLIPDPNKPNFYKMRHIDSLSSLSKSSELNRGCPGELLAVARACNITISNFESMVLIAQPTNQGCGPTHVETTSAIMTQHSLYGSVPEDYSRTSINTTALAKTVRTAHMRELVKNDITRPTLIDRGEEESIFRLVEKGKARNEFGYIPPTLEHLEDETMSIERLNDPLVNKKIHVRDIANETPLIAAINNNQFQLAKTMLLMTTDAKLKNKYTDNELDAMINIFNRSEDNVVFVAKLKAAKTPDGKTSSFLYHFQDFADSDLNTVLKYLHRVESQRQPVNGRGGKENPQEENRLQNEFAKQCILEQYMLHEMYFDRAIVASLIGIILPVISHIIIWAIYFWNRPEVSRVEVDFDAYVAMKNHNRINKKQKTFTPDDSIQERSAIREDGPGNEEENLGLRFRKVLTRSEEDHVSNGSLFLFFNNKQQKQRCLDKIHKYEYEERLAASPNSSFTMIR